MDLEPWMHDKLENLDGICSDAYNHPMFHLFYI